MYLPPQFKQDDPRIAIALMREHPFANLVSTDDTGLPFITPMPLALQEEQGGGMVLWGHCAKPNPHWRYLEARPRALAVFQGPHAYLSPRVYPDLARVPSWNYVAVHCEVQARLVTQPQEKDVLLKRLIAQHEPAYAQQWRDLGEEFQHKLLAGIVGFELRVQRWECKLKLNQHRKESHAALHALYSAGSPDEQGLAQWMERLGIVGQAPAAEGGAAP